MVVLSLDWRTTCDPDVAIPCRQLPPRAQSTLVSLTPAPIAQPACKIDVGSLTHGHRPPTGASATPGPGKRSCRSEPPTFPESSRPPQVFDCRPVASSLREYKSTFVSLMHANIAQPACTIDVGLTHTRGGARAPLDRSLRAARAGQTLLSR
jgi:hypothetical protein